MFRQGATIGVRAAKRARPAPSKFCNHPAREGSTPFALIHPLPSLNSTTVAMAESVSFTDFIKESRERKKKQALAQEILGSRGRKANGPGSLPNTRENSQKPSLLSRMSSSSGIAKQRSSSAKPAATNINDKWQHDMHHLNNPHGPPKKQPIKRTASASQVDRNTRAFNKFQSTLERNAEAPGFSIKGVANGGPTTVLASNFAPGTTAADIEAVMRDHAHTESGGELVSCRLITSNPTVVVELICSDKEGANNVIATFNGKKVFWTCTST